MKAGKRIIMIQISGFALLKALLLLYYSYLNQSHDIGFWMMISGGIGVAESRYIINVVIHILPDFLFYHYVCSKYIRQLKENYVYIFVREKSMKRWFRKFAAISLFDILLYEMITDVLLCFAIFWGQEKPGIRLGEFIVLILCRFVKLADIVIICDLLLLRFQEMVSVYANLLAQALPVFLTGVLYDVDGAWELAVKCIPFNWCNYNYLTEAEINPMIMLCLSAVFGWAVYLYAEKLFENYEKV